MNGCWISDCKKRGGDRFYRGIIQIDDAAREEYWTQIRGMPRRKDRRSFRG